MLFFVLGTGVKGQEIKKDTISQDKKKDKIVDWKLNIGQSIENSLTRSRPATLSAIFRRDTVPNSQSIQGFVELAIISSPKAENEREPRYSIFAELHQNSLISMPQNVIQFGFQHGRYFFTKGKYALNSSFTGRYSNNRISDVETGQVLTNFNLTHNDLSPKWYDAVFSEGNTWPLQDRKNFDNNKSKGKGSYTLCPSDFIQFDGSHSIGFQYVSNPEDLLMVQLSYELSLYPFSGLLYSVFGNYEFLSITGGIDYWERLAESDSNLFQGSLLNLTLGLNYVINEKKNQSIGLRYRYNEGGNPLRGLQDQIFSEISLSLLIGLESGKKK